MAKNNRICKISSRKKGICFAIFILLIGISSLSLVGNFHNDINHNSGDVIHPSREVSHTIQWVNNSGFDTLDNWEIVSINQGAGLDTEGEIDTTQGQTNLNILGNQGEFSEISGTPDSLDWNKTKNGNIVYPDNSGGDEFGFYANHWWQDPNDPNQSASVHWERIINLPVDMSDFNISSISLDVQFNATVTTQNATGDLYKYGIDVDGDDVDEPVDFFDDEYDYVRFYVLISDINRIDSYEIGFNQTSQLGRDGTSGTLSDSDIYIIPEESMRSYLTTLLEADSQHRRFIFTLGMRIYCADNGQGDEDIWNDLRILNCNFSFEYEKLIDRSSSISLKQTGSEIDGRNVIINSANLNFYYKINRSWSDLNSFNSEMRFLINNKEHNERIKLNEFTEIFSKASSNGFKIKNIINPYTPLNLSLQIFLGDNFELNETIQISFDNITLDIRYTEIFSDIGAEPWYTTYLFYGGSAVTVLIAGSLLSYIFIFRFPKPVRKVRKYKKSLRKESIPDIKVRRLERAFAIEYKRRVKTNPNLKKVRFDTLQFSKFGKMTIIIFVILNITLIPILISFNNLPHNHSINMLEINNSPIHVSREVYYTKNWLDNSNFDDDSNWLTTIEGDINDIYYDISGGEAKYLLLGKETHFIAAQGIPNSSIWNETTNPSFPNYPDTHQIIDNRGCYVSHTWTEYSDQSPSVHWERIINMPEEMDDNVITSVSMSTIINASVTTDSGDYLYGIDTISDAPDHYAEADYARFYVLFSDLNDELKYEVAYNQTIDLGNDGTSGILSNTFLKNIPEERMIDYLTYIFKRNSTAFKVTLGIRIWCEDSYQEDRDRWDELLIKDFNLNISYAEKIDQSTSLSLFQEGDKISGENIRIFNGNLRFKYKINDTWPQLASPSSEIRVLINDNPHSETIRLSSAIDDFQPNNPDGYDVTDLILKDTNINLSIQLYLADTFELNRTIQVSIDDVYLQISYVEVVFDITSEPWFNTALFIGVLAIASALSIYFLAYYQVLRFPIPIRKIRKYRKSLVDPAPPKGVITSDRESDFRKAFTQKLGDLSRDIPTKGPKSSFK
jgi:hypothetical protein